jgi:hypothetical protein
MRDSPGVRDRSTDARVPGHPDHDRRGVANVINGAAKHASNVIATRPFLAPNIIPFLLIDWMDLNPRNFEKTYNSLWFQMVSLDGGARGI